MIQLGQYRTKLDCLNVQWNEFATNYMYVSLNLLFKNNRVKKNLKIHRTKTNKTTTKTQNRKLTKMNNTNQKPGFEPRWSSEIVLTSIKCSTFKMISGITICVTENNARLICGFLRALRFRQSIKLTVVFSNVYLLFIIPRTSTIEMYIASIERCYISFQ
jgi:hypothetical protein